LKGSFMDSFTLGLLPKIDFNDEHNNNTQRQRLESLQIFTNSPLNILSKL
jgi:hypothetical protein